MHFPAGLIRGRVVRVDRGSCLVVTPGEAVTAVPSHALLTAAATDPASTPCIGDWVGVRRRPDGHATVETVLPRRTAFVRAAVAPGASTGQVLAANVDVVAVVEGLLPEPDLGRIERLLALAWDSGAQPIVVLTKADLVPDAPAVAAEVAAAAPGVEVLTVSAATGEGVAALEARLAPGVTLVFLGPSGSGKSTLTNRLLGEDRLRTRELRADGKGRHSTAFRELFSLPSGASVIDTPGLRSIGLLGDTDGLEQVFADLEEIAVDCRFPDCAHDREPGCAVLAAVDAGGLPARRLASWRKLQRETRWMAARADARVRAEQRAASKRLHKEIRRVPNRP